MHVLLDKDMLVTKRYLQFTSFNTGKSFCWKLPKVFRRSSFPLQKSFATTTGSRLSVLSLWTNNIIQWLSFFWIIDARSQSLILRKFETDLSLRAFVAGIASKIFKRMIAWERYLREFTENVFRISISYHSFVVKFAKC